MGDMVQSAGWTAFSKPTGPTPPTPPTPTPSPPSGACPPDAQEITSDDSIECLWVDGVGSFGYSWSDGDYECAPSARKAGKFCTWEDGEKGVTIPAGSSAECDKVSQGRIALKIPRTNILV